LGGSQAIVCSINTRQSWSAWWCPGSGRDRNWKEKQVKNSDNKQYNEDECKAF